MRLFRCRNWGKSRRERVIIEEHRFTLGEGALLPEPHDNCVLKRSCNKQCQSKEARNEQNQKRANEKMCAAQLFYWPTGFAANTEHVRNQEESKDFNLGL